MRRPHDRQLVHVTMHQLESLKVDQARIHDP